MPDATYYKTTGPTGTEMFHCLYCERGGQEHSATDPALFASHMAQRHDGRMVEGPAPEGAAETPLLVHPPDAPPAEPPVPAPDAPPAPATPPEERT
jgi:hypothetical protein